MLEIIPIDTPTLGDRSYLVHDGAVGLVIDPQRDYDRILALAEQHGVVIRHVFETHIHNDYVTGGYALAKAVGAQYHVNAEDPVRFERNPVSDGDVVDVSPGLRVQVLATPGHTYTHLSYAIEHDGTTIGVFTGGSLLYGATGRPDLLGPEHTHNLVRAQYRSAQRLAQLLPEQAAVFPTHGFGSFCSATQAEGNASTIGHERRVNPALTLDEQRYVDELLAGLDGWPAYYAHMAPANLEGPDEPDLAPPEPADAAELRRRIDAGEWVVDLRHRTAFAAGHLDGALSFGLDGSFATYLGWLIPWGTPVTLLGESAAQILEAQRELMRIGIERPVAAATGSPEDWSGGRRLATLRIASFRDLAVARSTRPIVVLDVRRRLEWDAEHVDGAVHIPLHELLNRLGEIPPGEIWVHCRSGYRSSVAASILAASGRTVVDVDDEFVNAARAGLLLIEGIAA